MISIHSPIGRRRRIPLMPLIDVIFILVMFFLLSSTFGVWRPLDVALGREGAVGDDVQSIASEKPPILIVIRPLPGQELAQVSVNGIETVPGQLATELNRLKELGAESAVLVPARGIEFQQVVSVLDEARSSRLKSVSLQID